MLDTGFGTVFGVRAENESCFLIAQAFNLMAVGQ
jgi:hypothetical protein